MATVARAAAPYERRPGASNTVLTHEEHSRATSDPATEPIVFVVDDDPEVRESVRRLASTVGVACETFATAREFLDAVDSARPACLVVDVRMPGMSGLDVQRELTARNIPLPTIMITGYGDVPTAVQALKAGAFDFIEKPFSRQLLLDRITQALVVARERHGAQAERAEQARRLARLTPRERQVLELVVQGRTNKAMAAELGLREKTIEVHRAHVMRKMGVGSLAELVRVTLALR
jgi:FixJ family two-component response regulator